jgi:hypothetical protein
MEVFENQAYERADVGGVAAAAVRSRIAWKKSPNYPREIERDLQRLRAKVLATRSAGQRSDEERRMLSLIADHRDRLASLRAEGRRW